MSDLFKQPNISKYDRNDPRYLTISETGIAKSDEKCNSKPITYKNKSIPSLKLLYARIMQVLFEKGENPNAIDLSHLQPGERELYLLIFALLNHFKDLSAQDQSGNIAFINTLSKTWNNLVLSVNRRRSQKHPHKYLEDLNEVIDSIDSYESEGGESFGFYLSHHAGKDADWFPIPYLQMISGIYENYVVDQDKSYLSAWSHDLSHLLIEISTEK